MIKKAFDIDPKILPSLLAGGAGALAGGTLTAMSPEREGESRGSRRWRILRNALLLGGAGAGGTALLQKGVHNTMTTLPAADVDPLKKQVHDFIGSKEGVGTGALLGAVGLGKTVAGEESRKANSIYAELLRKRDAQSRPHIVNQKTDALSAIKNWVSDNAVANAQAIKDKDLKLIRETTLNPTELANLNDLGVHMKFNQRFGNLRNRSTGAAVPKIREILADEAGHWGGRLTGIGRTYGVTKRLGGLGTLLAVPAIVSGATNYDEPELPQQQATQ